MTTPWMRLQRLPSRSLAAAVRGYRKFLSPLMRPSCRFQPSCSAYALEALEKKPFLRALLLISWRLIRCNPFHPGGYDPLK